VTPPRPLDREWGGEHRVVSPQTGPQLNSQRMSGTRPSQTPERHTDKNSEGSKRTFRRTGWHRSKPSVCGAVLKAYYRPIADLRST
jgi:hypothetical protein